MERTTIQSCVTLGIIMFFLIVSVIPTFNGHLVHDNQIICNHSRQKTSWFIDERAGNQLSEKSEENSDAITTTNEKTASTTGGPMSSSWPMQSHDVRHTGYCQYSTINNQGAEIWRVRGDETGAIESSAVIDNNSIIYFGTMGAD